MKIGEVKDMTSQMVQHYQRNMNAGQSADRQATTAQVPEEKVALSVQSRDLSQIKKAVEQLPEIRDEKVQELKAQIEKGLYQINSGKIAEKMVGESLIDLFA
jgi:negative regulator of flagellin synthesis FlgM